MGKCEKVSPLNAVNNRQENTHHVNGFKKKRRRRKKRKKDLFCLTGRRFSVPDAYVRTYGPKNVRPSQVATGALLVDSHRTGLVDDSFSFLSKYQLNMLCDVEKLPSYMYALRLSDNRSTPARSSWCNRSAFSSRRVFFIFSFSLFFFFLLMCSLL